MTITKNIGLTVSKTGEKLISIQDEKTRLITNTRLQRVLLNNPNYTLTYTELEDFLNSKIDFGKYKSGAVQDFIDAYKIEDFDVRQIKGLQSFDGKYKLEDFYDFSGKLVKIKDIAKSSGKKMFTNDTIKDIIKNNKNHPVADIFMIGENGFTWKEVLVKDPQYISKIVDFFDFSDPYKNKGLFKYYTNKANIDLYMQGELTPDDVVIPFKNSLDSFELELGMPKYDRFLDAFKNKGFTFIDTETTRFDHVVGSMLSFGYVKVKYNKENEKFEICDKGEIFIEDLKEPISYFSANGGTFGKYSGNKITEKVMKEKGLNPMEAAEKIKEIMDGGILFAHNASFDNGVLNTFFNDIKVEVPKVGKFYDTYGDAFPFFFQAIPKYRDMAKLGLDSLAEKVLGVNVKEDAERHTAMKDALWCSEILLKLINEPEIMTGYNKSNNSSNNSNNDEILTLF